MATVTRDLLAAALCMVALTAPLSATAGDFPGKGSRGQWSAALPYYNRGNRYLNEGRFDDAAADFQQAVSLYEFDPDFYTNLGLAYRKLDNYTEAEQAFKKATELSPDDWVPWMDLANAYLKQNKLKETIDAFNRTLKCNPPQADREAILGSISDIKKILRMQGGDSGDEPPPKSESTAQKQPGTTSKSGLKRPAQHRSASAMMHAAPGPVGTGSGSHTTTKDGANVSEQPSATGSAQSGTAKAAQAPASSNPHPARQATPVQTQQKPPGASDNKSLKQSGWDYIYK